MAEAIYTLCALTSLACTWLLLRGYARTRSRLLFWSGLCFLGLFLNNALLVVDKVALLHADLATWRHAIALAAMSLLLYGLIYDDE